MPNLRATKPFFSHTLILPSPLQYRVWDKKLTAIGNRSLRVVVGWHVSIGFVQKAMQCMKVVLCTSASPRYLPILSVLLSSCPSSCFFSSCLLPLSTGSKSLRRSQRYHVAQSCHHAHISQLMICALMAESMLACGLANKRFVPYQVIRRKVKEIMTRCKAKQQVSYATISTKTSTNKSGDMKTSFLPSALYCHLLQLNDQTRLISS